MRAWLAQSVQRLTTTWRIRGSNLGGGWDSLHPPSLLHKGYRVIPGGVARPRRGNDDQSHLEPRLKKIVVIPLHPPPVSSQQVIGWILPFFLIQPSIYMKLKSDIVHKNETSNVRITQHDGAFGLTLTLLTWTIWRAPTSASKWRIGFNSAFKGLMFISSQLSWHPATISLEHTAFMAM